MEGVITIQQKRTGKRVETVALNLNLCLSLYNVFRQGVYIGLGVTCFYSCVRCSFVTVVLGSRCVHYRMRSLEYKRITTPSITHGRREVGAYWPEPEGRHAIERHDGGRAATARYVLIVKPVHGDAVLAEDRELPRRRGAVEGDGRVLRGKRKTWRGGGRWGCYRQEQIYAGIERQPRTSLLCSSGLPTRPIQWTGTEMQVGTPFHGHAHPAHAQCTIVRFLPDTLSSLRQSVGAQQRHSNATEQSGSSRSSCTTPCDSMPCCHRAGSH